MSESFEEAKVKMRYANENLFSHHPETLFAECKQVIKNRIYQRDQFSAGSVNM